MEDLHSQFWCWLCGQMPPPHQRVREVGFYDYLSRMWGHWRFIVEAGFNSRMLLWTTGIRSDQKYRPRMLLLLETIGRGFHVHRFGRAC